MAGKRRYWTPREFHAVAFDGRKMNMVVFVSLVDIIKSLN